MVTCYKVALKENKTLSIHLKTSKLSCLEISMSKIFSAIILEANVDNLVMFASESGPLKLSERMNFAPPDLKLSDFNKRSLCNVHKLELKLVLHTIPNKLQSIELQTEGTLTMSYLLKNDKQ
jgi:hypothetical protein